MPAYKQLGSGWPFPIALDERGRFPLRAGPDKVADSIRIILDTEPGERIMRPTFGCGLRRYLMQPNTAAVRAMMRLDVERALEAHEPRISLEQVRVEPGDDPALVLIEIRYRHVRDGQPNNLVYPFYLQR
jgi:phage baseplate assembly protein W